MSLRQVLERAANGALSPLGVRLMRRGRAPTIGGRRMSDQQVIAEAERQGVSAGDLLEQLFDKAGRANTIIDRMAAAGARPRPAWHVVEIGAGSGIYIQHLLAHGPVERYEVYELEPNRAAYLSRTFPVVAQPADGETLHATASRSVDLVHAHGVFVTLEFLTTSSYFREIARVIAPGGHAVFDVITESCLDEAAIEGWLGSRLRYASMLSRGYVTAFFERHGFVLVDEFAMPLLVHGRSQYLIFKFAGGASTHA